MAEIAAHMAVNHPDYARLAGRIAVSCLYKSTHPRFSLFVAEYSRRSGTLTLWDLILILQLN